MTLLAPGSAEFSTQFDTFAHSCFRIECLPCYRGSGEDDSLRAFLAGGCPSPHPGKLSWMRTVAAAVADGRVMQRVHVVAEPLTPYLEFEIAWSYAWSVSAGEDVRLLPVRDGWPAEIPHEDWWLFDSARLFRMRYTADGTWLGSEPATGCEDVLRSCRVRDAALHWSQPWADYIRSHPQLAGRVPTRLRP